MDDEREDLTSEEAQQAAERWRSVDSSEEYNEKYAPELTPEENEYAPGNYRMNDEENSSGVHDKLNKIREDKQTQTGQDSTDNGQSSSDSGQNSGQSSDLNPTLNQPSGNTAETAEKEDESKKEEPKTNENVNQSQVPEPNENKDEDDKAKEEPEEQSTQVEPDESTMRGKMQKIDAERPSGNTEQGIGIGDDNGPKL